MEHDNSIVLGGSRIGSLPTPNTLIYGDKARAWARVAADGTVELLDFAGARNTIADDPTTFQAHIAALVLEAYERGRRGASMETGA